MKPALSIFLIYALLTAITTAVMQDFSLRYTLFLLVDAILLVAGGHLFKEKKEYYRAVAFIAAVLGSAFVIRVLTSASLKVWDVDTYLSFCLAVGNVLLVTVSLLPVKGKLKTRYLMGGKPTCVSPHSYFMGLLFFRILLAACGRRHGHIADKFSGSSRIYAG